MKLGNETIPQKLARQKGRIRVLTHICLENASGKDRLYFEFVILTPKLPSDAAALIALTNDDLLPDKLDEFCIWSSKSRKPSRRLVSCGGLADPSRIEIRFLRRTLQRSRPTKPATCSRCGHCTKWECVMSGTNHMNETDRRPIDACPRCTAKICWLSEADQKERYDKLAAFCRKNGLNKRSRRIQPQGECDSLR